MNTPARKHHFLPQTYLAGFTDSGTSKGKFFVLDQKTKNSFITSPKNVAAERDFNRLDIQGQPPDTLELSLANFERDLTPALKRIRSTSASLNQEDLGWVVNLLTLIIVRNPRTRRNASASMEQGRRVFWDLLTSDKSLFENHLRMAQESEKNLTMNITFEEAKDFLKEHPEIIEVTPHENSKIELEIYGDILNLLGKRQWSLLLAPPEGPDFICSDHPVGFRFKKPGGIRYVGYGIPNTEVFFPIDYKHGLFGVFEDPLSPLVNLNSLQVSELNARVISSADKQVFSRERNFSTIQNGEVMEIKHIVSNP